MDKIMKLLIEKFDGKVSEEDLKGLAESLKTIISEKVDTRVEAEIDRLTEKADEFCEIQIAEKTEAIEKELAEGYEEKLDTLEETVISKLDSYLESEISEKISDDILKAVAINETLLPLVNGIKDLYENKFVALDTEGSGMIREANEKIAELEEKQVELINEKMELNKTAELAAIKLLISEKSLDLTDDQRDKLSVLAEGKAFDELHGKIDTYIEMVTESEASTIVESEDDADEVVDSSECLTESNVDLSDKDEDTQKNSFDAIQSLL